MCCVSYQLSLRTVFGWGVFSSWHPLCSAETKKIARQVRRCREATDLEEHWEMLWTADLEGYRGSFSHGGRVSDRHRQTTRTSPISHIRRPLREPFLTMLGPFTSPSGFSWDQTQQIQLLRKESPMTILPRCNHQQNCSGYGRSWPKKTTLTNWKSILVHIIWPCDIWGSWIWVRRDWGVFSRGTKRTSLSLRSALFLCLELNASHGNSWGLWTRRTPLPQQLPSSRVSVRFPPPPLL